MRKIKKNDSEDIKILVVDDDIRLLEVIKNMIEKKTGIECIIASEYEKAIQIASSKYIDILVVDYLLEMVTGLQIVKKLKDFNTDIYAILYTGYTELIPAEKALENYDIEAYLEKKDDLNELLFTVMTAIKIVRKYIKVPEKQYRKKFRNPRNFSEKIKFLRAKHNLTQEQLANKLSVSRSTIANYETDNNPPAIKQLQNLAEYFNISIDYLLGSNDDL